MKSRGLGGLARQRPIVSHGGHHLSDGIAGRLRVAPIVQQGCVRRPLHDTVLAVGREIPSLRVPLVLPKASVYVTNVAGPYVVARTATYEVTIEILPVLGGRKETRRRELPVNEKELVGNPASSPVAVGDPVIRAGDEALYVTYLQSKASD